MVPVIRTQEVGWVRESFGPEYEKIVWEPQDVCTQFALNVPHIYLLEFGNILASVPPKMRNDCCANRVFLVSYPCFAFSTPQRATQKEMMPPMAKHLFN